jgi:hypothetical protein
MAPASNAVFRHFGNPQTLRPWMDDRTGLHSRAAAEMRDDACRLRGSALVTMVELANQNGNDPSSFWWLDWPRLRRILLQS